MADLIQLLPDHVANQIAAGEVVQRPASVVKELLENAIDARAGTVKLIVKEGGKTLIQVVDDGIGMSPTDARLSFERHATSKIRIAEDLFQLNTKGFRGEALASIAAISHVEMLTRPGDDEVGTQIRVEGSEVVLQEVAATPAGTSIAVKNLFFNIPARRNFLKSNQVEFRHITDEFHRIALAHPQVAFHFFHNGNELFNLPATKIKQRIVHIFGSRMDEKLVPVKEETQVVNISGFICKPAFAKKSRGEQFFFVNNRYIKSPYLNHAISAAFEGLVKPDAHPGYFLYLEVDPSSIDINIHPTKTEIKFDDEQTLYAIIRSTVKHSLGQFSVAPVLDFEHDPNLDTPYNYQGREALVPRVSVDAQFNPFKSAGNKPATSASSGNWDSMYVGLESKVGQEDEIMGMRFESDTITGTVFETQKEETHTGNSTFQLRRKYVVTTIKSGMLVIDQNRAHQRILYEKFLKSATVKKAISQQLLFPLPMRFSKNEMAVLNEIRDSLRDIGFAFSNPGEEGIEITGVPPLVPESEVGLVIDQLIADYQEQVGGSRYSQSEILSKTLAKNLAVKSGMPLDPSSQMALVDDLFACKEARVSPFNKPTYITLSENEIQKKFL